MTAVFDIAIVGGGVAGSSLATVLSRRGLSVVVIEREERFRDRVRGEGIHPWGVAEVNRLGLDPILAAAKAQPLPVWQSYENRVPKEPFHWAELSIDGHPEIGVFHPDLQNAAITAAVDSGATLVRPARVTAIRPGPEPEIDLVESGLSRTIRARLIVGADGRQSAARRAIGAKTLRDEEHHRFGGVLVRGLSLQEDSAHEASYPGGRAFVLPQGNGQARAYVVTAPDFNADVMADRSGLASLGFLASLFPEGRWANAKIAGPIAFFANADEWAQSIHGQGVVLIGDAAGANDPSVGNGMSLVFRDIRVLADLLLEDRDWQRAIEEFARLRRSYFDVLRHHAKWLAILTTEEGPESDLRRERVRIARERDPLAGGFSAIFARGPDGLDVNVESRRLFFGD